ncbi:DUF2075 domain-containing protein [Corynebacterium cystitidis]|nr:DUF2075 domain-containing protein [Corynebacterium cystitidis]
MANDLHYVAGESEQRSWASSIPLIAADIKAAGLENVDVLLEYSLPLTSHRADLVLAGSNPDTGDPSFVILELKQWSQASLFEEDPNLVLVPGLPTPRTHPLRQVDGYREYLLNFLGVLEGRDAWVSGVAYLHNVLNQNDVEEILAPDFESNSRIFLGSSRRELRDFLREKLSPQRSTGTADLLLGSSVKPAQKLMTVAADEVRRREQFTLLDNQQAAVDLVHHEVHRAAHSNQKRIVIVSGGPGTGKSVIALSLLGELAREGHGVLHATGSRSFTQTLRKVAGHRSKSVQSLFKYFNNFTQAEPSSVDVLVADEAHRIRESSNHRFTRADLRSDRRQIDELVSVARVPVFLLDQNQVVRQGEMGSVEEIQSYADSKGLDTVVVELGEQFRCGGSQAYIDWAEQILGLADADPRSAVLPANDDFIVEVVDSPWTLESQLRDKLNEGYSARMVAGFCWPWSDADRKNKTLYPDVQIGDWKRPWNSREDRRLGDAPPSALWATAEGGFGQVGCVYTAQGFEFDWVGVILGPDLVWRDGQFVSVRQNNKDPHFRSTKKISDEEFDGLLRHIYKVLLTRGMIGTLIYSPDEETRGALRRLLA